MRGLRRSPGGFTLMEILAAFMILSLGVTSVLGILTSTVSRERAAVMRGRIGEAIPFVTELVREHVARPGEPEPIARRPVPGFPGLYFLAAFTPLQDWYNEYVARIGLTWQQGGAARVEQFVLILSGAEPYHRRAANRLFGGEESVFQE